jgi:hypothetical protein
MLVFLSKLDKSIDQAEFEAVVRKICKQVGIKNPNWLMICMYAESAMKLVTNAIGAYGFIQITKSTAINDLKISPESLKKLSWQGYMEQVEKYLQNRIKEKKGVVPNSAYELYSLIHYPVSYQKPDTYILYSKGSDAYTGNKNLDYNKDGKVTMLEIKKFLDSKCPAFYDKAQLLKAEDSTVNFYYANYAIAEVLIAFAITTILVVGIGLYGIKNHGFQRIIQKLKPQRT